MAMNNNEASLFYQHSRMLRGLILNIVLMLGINAGRQINFINLPLHINIISTYTNWSNSFPHPGCLPLLIQLLHGNNKDMHLLGNTRGTREARTRAAKALRNIVHSNPDNKSARREARVLRLLEQIRAHCDQLRSPSDEEVEKQLERSGKSVFIYWLDFYYSLCLFLILLFI